MVQRKAPQAFEEACRQTSIYRAAFHVPPTTEDIVSSAAEIASRYQIQFWDALMCASSHQASAKALLTEDMQDGQTLHGVKLINPFKQSNDALVEGLF